MPAEARYDGCRSEDVHLLPRGDVLKDRAVAAIPMDGTNTWIQICVEGAPVNNTVRLERLPIEHSACLERPARELFGPDVSELVVSNVDAPQLDAITSRL